MTFTKLFSSITESTVWCEPDPTRIVWITMLAMSNKNGYVFASVPGLANRARVDVEKTRAAIETFLSPDPDSRTPDYEGRRIEVVDGGWRLLNYHKHREIRDEEDRKAYQREYHREYRKQHRKQSKSESTTVNQGKPQSTQAEAEAEAEAIKTKTNTTPLRGSRIPADFCVTENHRAFAMMNRLPDPETQIGAFKDYWESKAGKDAMKLDWNKTFQNWLRNSNGRRGLFPEEGKYARIEREALALVDREEAERTQYGSVSRRTV